MRQAPPPALSLLPFVVVGGAAGGLVRWWLGVLVPDGDGFASTTFAINVAGSFALALLPHLLLDPSPLRLPDPWRHRVTALVGPGLLGGFTSLSAWSLTTRWLLDEGEATVALGYTAATLVATVAAVALARALVRPAAPRTAARRSPDGARR